MQRTQLERKDARSPASIVALVLIGLFALSLILLFLWGVITSLKTRFDFRNNMFGLPERWMFSNYVKAFTELKISIPASSGGTRDVMMLEMVLYSLLTSIVPEALLVLWTAICTYTLAKYRFRGRKLIYNVMIVVMVLPIVGNLAAQLEFQQSIGVYDELWWQWITAPAVWGGNFLVLYAVYKSISWEYAEAAFMDGAGHHRVFWSIMLPLSKTTLFVLFLLGFITRWNNYQLSLVYLPSYPTLAYGLYRFQFMTNDNVSQLPIQMAANIIACIPTFILFILFRNKMMGALTMGGIKG